MPERAEILARAMALKDHCWADELEPQGNAIWTGKAHGATFELTKPGGVIFESQGDVVFLELTLKGKVEGKKKLREEFVAAFGKPEVETPAKRFRTSHIVIWNNAKALQSQ